eukprot:TRINITY_DN2905_c0_g1_i1.p1 TRINITY_DN2905_c0_g1~~TRINITY_DN2905_c0_g1_i1.p1  ORF type:complete len:163 (-),score=47.32 TRINITY_DN2905_c0_g1_i1:133-621(-)
MSLSRVVSRLIASSRISSPCVKRCFASGNGFDDFLQKPKVNAVAKLKDVSLFSSDLTKIKGVCNERFFRQIMSPSYFSSDKFTIKLPESLSVHSVILVGSKHKPKIARPPRLYIKTASSRLSGLGYFTMNRNARKPRKANHGKRPCGHTSRRAKNPRRVRVF